MTDLSPARQALLGHVVNTQEQCLNGCMAIFTGLSKSSDPEAVLVSAEALRLLTEASETIEAMIDGLNATYH